MDVRGLGTFQSCQQWLNKNLFLDGTLLDLDKWYLIIGRQEVDLARSVSSLHRSEDISAVKVPPFLLVTLSGEVSSQLQATNTDSQFLLGRRWHR